MQTSNRNPTIDGKVLMTKDDIDHICKEIQELKEKVNYAELHGMTSAQSKNEPTTPYLNPFRKVARIEQIFLDDIFW